MKRLLTPLAALALAAGAHANEGVPAPLVDHHQHLVSPAGAAMLNAPPKLAEPLPAEIGKLLAARVAAWNDAAALARLYAPDASAVNVFDEQFLRGPEAIGGHFAKLFRTAYILQPSGAELQNGRTRLYGLYTEPVESGGEPIAFMLLDLVRQPGGEWLIAREDLVYPGPDVEKPVEADDLIAELDKAGIGKAVVLSVAYWFGKPALEDGTAMLAAVRAENDWTIAQAARFPERLIAFCSVNPMRDHAMAEIERCRKAGGRGLKMHFSNSDVYLAEPGVAERLRQIFALANRLGMPIVIHSRDRDGYGAREARILLDTVIPAAPDVPVQIAHLWGGAGYSGEALKAFADAFDAGHPSTRNLWFDLTDAGVNSDEAADGEIAGLMRRIGLGRMLYGSDAPIQGHATASESWNSLKKGLPLTDAEWARIAGNTAPYMK